MMFTYLDKVYPVPPALIDELMDGGVQFIKLRHRQFLLEAGDVCKNLYFIHKGLLRCYYIKENEETGEETEVNTWFMRERDICVSVHSYYKQAPSYEYIQALEDCELICIAHDKLEEVYRKYIDFNFIGRVLTVEYLLDWAEQLKDIRMLKAQQRYEAFRKRAPELEQRVPQKYLASFLDMQPETLSRARGN